MALIIDGKAVAQRVRAEAAQEAAALRERGIEAGLAVVLVGDDPASTIYVRNKTRACQEAGIRVFDHHLPASASAHDVAAVIDRLSDDDRVHGVLLQLPLPAGLDAQLILSMLDPAKDVDALLPDSVGRLWQGRPRAVPCTPLGCMRLLEEAATPIAGAHAVVIGRSQLVGKPMAALLLSANATVSICHSQTKNLAELVRSADIVIAAAGRAELVRGDWIAEGATVIDVGINRMPDGKLRGDVEFETASRRARAITPVPGGVGPMTIAMLLKNTVAAARRSLPDAR